LAQVLIGRGECFLEKVNIVDSHTGGEPTRVVLSSPLNLDAPSMADRAAQFISKYDAYRRAIVCEPRGSDIMVGALLTEPTSTTSVAGVIFFNNVGTLGMCGHGLMGVGVVLGYLGRIGPGKHFIDTPVGTVGFELLGTNHVRIENVGSYRWQSHQELVLFPNTPNAKTVHGDIAWGGNWFFICADHNEVVDHSNIARLQQISLEIRKQIELKGLTGKAGQIIDHVELIGPPSSSQKADARNFVLCPGAAYDRSPCGTGTSAKLACLAADGKLLPGQVYRQESVVGSIFQASYQLDQSTGSTIPCAIVPTIEGFAYVNGSAELLLDHSDPFCWGLESQ
jgi:4-hydroxyproline epimerase